MFKQQSVTDITSDYEQQRAKLKNSFFKKLDKLIQDSVFRLETIAEARKTLDNEADAASKQYNQAQVAIANILKD